MGSNDGEDNEKPQHKVYLNAFEIAKYPLTNQQYEAFIKDTDYQAPRHWNGRKAPVGKENHLVVYISWHDAEAYAKWLSQKTGKDYRLPTEAEWEKAARGTDARAYPWEGDYDPSKCNVERSIGDTTPVGIYPQGASPYDVMDMAGNVWKWCADWYDEHAYQDGERHNPTGPENGQTRVLRGGSWSGLHDGARCAFRSRSLPVTRSDLIGVRFSGTV
jgi:formylglycine-generating enzyme required for sulfatase activity